MHDNNVKKMLYVVIGKNKMITNERYRCNVPRNFVFLSLLSIEVRGCGYVEVNLFNIVNMMYVIIEILYSIKIWVLPAEIYWSTIKNGLYWYRLRAIMFLLIAHINKDPRLATEIIDKTIKIQIIEVPQRMVSTAEAIYRLRAIMFLLIAHIKERNY